ncbi:MAG: pilus assembly PilX N-terminal domain-containing protein [Desulfobacterales bacterium]|nr:pilus assembly PilX N-terminal domain-containing protein [Desulfobacterales bacterium]
MMQQVKIVLKNEKGSTIVISLMILVLLTVIGISATHTSTVETLISTNDLFNKITFYAAESGWQISVNWLDSQYPLSTIDGGLDMTGGAIGFTNAKFGVPDTFQLASNNGFSAKVSFAGANNVPGYSTEFKRYRYEVESTGRGPRDSEATIEVTLEKLNM